jgi:hypothetical protein
MMRGGVAFEGAVTFVVYPLQHTVPRWCCYRGAEEEMSDDLLREFEAQKKALRDAQVDLPQKDVQIKHLKAALGLYERSARITRFVATGYLRTYSVVPASMQQK